jgi:transcriptional regulator with XRE-family HTH domain
MSAHIRENLMRLMVARGISVHQLAELCDLDERTVRGVLTASHRPHPKTLHRLAEGLAVNVDELFVDPARLLYRRFDQQTNPVVAEVLETHGELFEGWTEADFDELHSRVGTGGALTAEGTLQSVQHMNHKREMQEKLDLLLESSQATVTADILNALCKSVTVEAAS